jgi:hypothetical protein
MRTRRWFGVAILGLTALLYGAGGGGAARADVYLVQDGTHDFGTLNLATGAFTHIAFTAQNFESITVTPDRTLYGEADNGHLYIINPATGATTQVGTATAPEAVLGLAAQSNTTLLGTTIGTNRDPTHPRFYSIPANGADLTSLGAFSVGIYIQGSGALAFGPSGVLYYNAHRADFVFGDEYTDLFSVNPANGTLTEIGRSVGVFGILGLLFDGTTFFGVDTSTLAPPGIYTINTTTGTATLIGEVSGLPTGYANAVAFIPPLAVPEPSTLALFGVGVAVLAGWRWLKRRLAVSFLALTLLALPFSATARADYVYTTIDIPGAKSTQVVAINNSGEVSGDYNNGSQNIGFIRDTAGNYTTLNPIGTSVGADVINNSGVVAGSGKPYDFIRSANGSITTFMVPGSLQTNVYAINDYGTVGGLYEIRSFGELAYIREPSGKITTFSIAGRQGSVWGLNNAGVAVGTPAFIRDPSGNITTFSVNGFSTSATAINNYGEIAGYFVENDNKTFQGFTRDAMGNITVVDPFGSSDVTIKAINDSGEVAGIYDNIIGNGFVRDAAGNITTINPPGSIGTDVRALNNAGVVAGFYTDAKGTHGFIATPLPPPPPAAVPEPSTLALFALSTAALGGWRWRKRREQ